MTHDKTHDFASTSVSGTRDLRQSRLCPVHTLLGVFDTDTNRWYSHIEHTQCSFPHTVRP